jgi:hypothetical protein
MNPYMYLWVRGDLSHPAQIVQTCHAVDELAKRYQSDGTNHMVLCHADNEEHLLSIADYLDDNGIDYEMFREPDMDNQYTAIATKPLRGREREPLRIFKLKR